MEALAVKPLPWTYLGQRPYLKVWDLQEKIRSGIQEGKLKGHLLLVEHPPTISVGRGEPGTNVLFDHDTLKARGFDVVETNRGGMVTYHGPGQLVAYPVVDLKMFKMGVKAYIHALEETMILMLARFGIEGSRKEGSPGVWVGPKKIGSIGIHVRRQISIHGLALNVLTDLSHFDVITPCGIAGVRMTSIRSEGKDVSLDQAAQVFVEAFSSVFGIAPVNVQEEPLYV
ncbi:MAG: lipoyl(octanoyl) transferase LipB [Pseudomonadota bacterium]